MFFNDYLPVPSATAHVDATNDVILRWEGSSTRVNYKVYGSSDYLNIVSLSNLLATIPGSNPHEYNVGSSNSLMYYQILTVSAP